MLGRKAILRRTDCRCGSCFKPPAMLGGLADIYKIRHVVASTQRCEAVARLPIDELPDDAVIHVLSWLGMFDMITVSQVAKRWRYLALSTSSLWQDVRLEGYNTRSFNQFAAITARTKELPIHITIKFYRGYFDYMQIGRDILRVFGQHAQRIASLAIESSCVSATELLTSIPAYKDAASSDSRTDVRHSPTCRSGSVWVRFPDMRRMQAVELRGGVFPCLNSLPAVREVQVLDPGSDYRGLTMETMDRLSTSFPGMTSLSVTSKAVPYFSDPRALDHFVTKMSGIAKLSIETKLFDSQAGSVAGVLRWPVRTIELDVSSSGNGFARQARRIVRERLSSDSVLTVRSARKHNATGGRVTKYHITLFVNAGVGREFTFVHDSFSNVLQNYLTPFLCEKQVNEVVLNGHAACTVFYHAACGTADLAHIRLLRIVAGDPDTICVPHKELRLRGLKELVLEKDDMRGSRIGAATVEGLVSMLSTNTRVALRIRNVFVYADSAAVNIEQYVNLVEGVVCPSSWRHITSSTE